VDADPSRLAHAPTRVRLPERTERLRAVFERSRNAMLIADDARRYRDVNEAACRLLGAPREWILRRRVDDFTPPELRGGIDEMWRAFIAEGTQAGEYELLLPDGRRRAVDYSATANIVPGMHLSILLPLVRGAVAEGDPDATASTALTRREAEVMGLVALGANTEEIAERLAITQETARTHAKNAMQKLGARSRAHAVALALSSGELTLT
jgi:PAS domain S-box-containing protein